MQVLTNFLDRHANGAVALAWRLYDERDHRMVALMQGRSVFDVEVVVRWMSLYGLFQGIPAQDRRSIALAVKDLRAPNPSNPEDGAETVFRVMGALNRVRQRGWLSASTKVGWCLNPSNVVIVDQLVVGAVNVLKELDDSLVGLPRLGSVPLYRAGGDDALINFYKRFARAVSVLSDSYVEQLDRINHRQLRPYPHRLRLLDQYLWLLGGGQASRTPVPIDAPT